MNYKFYKDKNNDIWLMPAEFVKAGVLDGFIDLDRFGFKVDLDLLVNILNSKIKDSN